MRDYHTYNIGDHSAPGCGKLLLKLAASLLRRRIQKYVAVNTLMEV